MSTWKKPSGALIEINDEPQNVAEAERLGWVKQSAKKKAVKKAPKKAK